MWFLFPPLILSSAPEESCCSAVPSPPLSLTHILSPPPSLSLSLDPRTKRKTNAESLIPFSCYFFFFFLAILSRSPMEGRLPSCSSSPSSATHVSVAHSPPLTVSLSLSPSLNPKGEREREREEPQGERTHAEQTSKGEGQVVASSKTTVQEPPFFL